MQQNKGSKMNKPEVLVIEDDHAIGNLIATALESQECSYHLARTGSAIKKLVFFLNSTYGGPAYYL